MLVMYAVTVAAQIYAQTFDKRAMMQRAWYGVAGAFVIHTLLVAWRWIETGHIPTIGNFENALAGAWFIVFMVIWAGWKERHPLLAAGALPFALVILGGGAMSDATARPMSASLRSFWLYIHIFFAWLAYGGYTVACGAGIAWLTKSRRAGAASSAVRDDLARLEELMFRSTVFGFITDAVMIAAGSIWAKDLWGAYWSWDPVETWSLLSWLIYGLALHLRITMGWRGRKLAWLLVFAIVGVLISFWGVNLVMEGSAHVFNVG
jgi:cytochrome c-type biogenesis protein CcsB